MLCQFLVLTDTHFFAPGLTRQDRTWWNHVLQSQCEQIADSLVETIKHLKPDFIIHCGDLTGHCEMVNYDFSCQVMDSTGSPWFVVPGNHDTWFPGVREAIARRIDTGSTNCYFSKELGGFKFIFLDVAFWYSSSGESSPYLDKELYDTGQITGMGPSTEELSWFEEQLNERDDTRAIIVSHAPLAFRHYYPCGTLPGGEPAQDGEVSIVELMGDIIHRKQLCELIERSGKVALAFSGHWHINDMIRQKGIIHCQTASMREYPFELRQCIIHRNNIDITTIGLNNPQLSNLSYIPEWGNGWVAGMEHQRAFTVRLNNR